MSKKKVLIVDDEVNIVELIRMNLESSGYEVMPAYTGMEAITKTNSFLPDLILLDLMLPDIDGLQICQMFRLNENTKDIPIIMITARSEEEDKVQGLIMGADDYITKPFSVKELEARIQTVLRRADKTGMVKDKLLINPNIIRYKDITIDTTKYEVKRGAEEIDLTLTEYKILKMLIENRDRVVPREALLDEIGIEKAKTDSRSLDVHIRNIRKKLEEGTDMEYIETVRGIGYMIK